MGFLPASSLNRPPESCCLLLPPVEFFFYLFHHTAKPTDLVTSLTPRDLTPRVFLFRPIRIFGYKFRRGGYFITDFLVGDASHMIFPVRVTFHIIFQFSWKVSAPVSGCAIFFIFILWVQKTSVNCLAAALSFARFRLETPLNWLGG